MPTDFLPLKATDHLALLALAEEPTWGLELLERMDARSRGRVRPNAGTLYRVLARLVDAGLVEPAGSEPGPEGGGAPRKIYAVTGLGRAVLAAEAGRQAELVEMAHRLGLAGR